MKPPIPTSDGFWILSSAFRDAGDAALAKMSEETYSGFICIPCTFLYFRCIELALKSVLKRHGVPEREIACKLGHRLSPLLNKVEELVGLHTLGIGVDEKTYLDERSDDYADKWFEYSDDLWDRKLQDPKIARDLAHRVSEAIRLHGVNNLNQIN